MPFSSGKLLSQINKPADLRNLGQEELNQVCSELRQLIIDVVSVKGGHFSANLGTVELTVALHYVFDTPFDQLVWDVGHQAYAHKILSGRRDVFHTIRQYQGISGFPKRSESAYDTFGVGHSSTSVSALLGMAVADSLKGESERQHIAVIGDGAMTAGMVFEALNNAGGLGANMLVILNDNSMSIDPNVGALTKYLRKLTNIRQAEQILNEAHVDNYGELFQTNQFFDAFGFRYSGVADGHNLTKLIELLRQLKMTKGPKLLHVRTVKGKGYLPAEQNQSIWHAPGFFDKFTGEIRETELQTPGPPKYQDVFGQTLVTLASNDKRIVGITPAMVTGCSMHFMMQEFPERTFDVGIAEQHAVTFSAGMATQGMIPFCNIYSTFLQRAYDQLIHDVAIQNLHVIFCIDRSGLVGADGATHHGAYDLAYLRCIPNLVVSAPMNEAELRNLMLTAAHHNGPFCIRYPRGNGVLTDWEQTMQLIEIGKGRKLKNGKDIAILCIGHIGNTAMTVTEMLDEAGIQAALYDMRFIKPLDEKLLHEVFLEHQLVLTIEDGCVQGGMGSTVLEFMNLHGYHAKIERLGIPDRFIEQGNQQELWIECGLDTDSVYMSALALHAAHSKANNR